MNASHNTTHALKDQVILITGAGQGIGKTAALAFAAQGATVILLGRTQAKLEKVYDEIIALPYPEPVIFPLDLAKAQEDDYRAMAEGIYQQIGRLDGILHNATHFDNLSPLEIQTAEQFTRMFTVNVIAPFALTKACLPLLRKAPQANVVFTGHSGAEQPTAYWGALGVSKKAMQHLVNTWQQELENEKQLRLHLTTPNAVQSPQRKKSHPGEFHEDLPTMQSLMQGYIGLFATQSE